MNREEILKLHTLTKEEQIKKLKAGRVIKEYPDAWSHGREIESLADCAFRLRDEARMSKLQLEMFQVWYSITDQTFDVFGCSEYYLPEEIIDDCIGWFCLQAKPIHWIQAAWLAKESKNE